MTGITALMIFAALTLALMATYVNYRVLKMLGGKPADSWTRGAEITVPPFVKRAQDAHLNCVENLPVFGAIVLASFMLGRESVVDDLAIYVIAARVAQIATHLIGVNHWLVVVRATFYTVQVALFVYMLYALLAG
jgi:uncharacterized MAPEG superfamily protein